MKCWTGFRFLWKLSKFKTFWFENLMLLKIYVFYKAWVPSSDGFWTFYERWRDEYKRVGFTVQAEKWSRLISAAIRKIFIEINTYYWTWILKSILKSILHQKHPKKIKSLYPLKTSGFYDFVIYVYLDVSHITNAIRHYLYKIQKLLRFSNAVCEHTIQSTYTSTRTVCNRREHLFSLETLREFGN